MKSIQSLKIKKLQTVSNFDHISVSLCTFEVGLVCLCVPVCSFLPNVSHGQHLWLHHQHQSWEQMAANGPCCVSEEEGEFTWLHHGFHHAVRSSLYKKGTCFWITVLTLLLFLHSLLPQSRFLLIVFVELQIKKKKHPLLRQTFPVFVCTSIVLFTLLLNISSFCSGVKN